MSLCNLVFQTYEEEEEKFALYMTKVKPYHVKERGKQGQGFVPDSKQPGGGGGSPTLCKLKFISESSSK